MVHTGVMALNDLIYEALWECDYYIYGQTDAVADCQWHPLEGIASDFRNKKLSKKAARTLFQKALKLTDIREIDYLTLEDALEDRANERLQAAIREEVHSWGHEEQWTIFSDLPVVRTGTSYNPFDYLSEGGKGEVKMVLWEGSLYFLETNNIVDGWNTFGTIISEGKSLPLYEVTLLPEPPTIIGEKAPTYGPPRDLVEMINEEVKRQMSEEGLSLVEVFERAGV